METKLERRIRDLELLVFEMIRLLPEQDSIKMLEMMTNQIFNEQQKSIADEIKNRSERETFERMHK